jgi:hypothetical protein
MYPGAQEEVRIRLFHQTTFPQAGYHTLSVVISAPVSYPGEELLLQQKIYVAPVFKQGLEIIDDLKAETKTLKETPASASQVALDGRPPASPVPRLEEVLAPSPAVRVKPAAPADQISNLGPQPVRDAPVFETHPIQTVPASANLPAGPIEQIPQPTPQSVTDIPVLETLQTKIAPAAASTPAEQSLPAPQIFQPEQPVPVILEPQKIIEPAAAVAAPKNVPAPPQRAPMPKPKVVHGPSDEFWDQ